MLDFITNVLQIFQHIIRYKNMSVAIYIEYFSKVVQDLKKDNLFGFIGYLTLRSAISWQSVLLVKETGVPRENHRMV